MAETESNKNIDNKNNNNIDENNKDSRLNLPTTAVPKRSASSSSNASSASSSSSFSSDILSSIEKKEKIEEKNFISLNNMNDLIKHACFSLEQFINPKLSDEKQIPLKILSEAKAVMLITIINNNNNNGFFGKGILLLQDNNHIEGWNPPIAIALNHEKNDKNFQHTIHHLDTINGNNYNDKIYCFIIVNDIGKLQQFITNEKDFELKNIFIGPFGRDNDLNTPLNIDDKRYMPMLSYSINNHNDFLQFSLSDKHISILDEYNHQYYNDNNLDYNKIMNGEIKAPFNEEFVGLIKMLDQYTRQQAVTFKNLLTQQR